MTYDFAKYPEVYPITKDESIALAELVFAYLACTIGPGCSRGSHLWTAKYRNKLTNIIYRAYLKPEVSAAAMFFVGRLKRRQPDLELNARAGLNMFVAALVVADKSIHDRSVLRKDWLKITNYSLSLPQLLALEMEFLDDIGWDTSLPDDVFLGFDDITKGWKAVRQHSWPVDFFHNRRWENIRPPAFDFFDGLLENVDLGDMYFPSPKSDLEWDQWGDPVFYDLEPSFWEDPPYTVAVVDPRERSSASSSSCGSSISVPDSSDSDSLIIITEASGLDGLEPETCPFKTTSPISKSSHGTYDDLTTIDWDAEESESSPSELILLGVRRSRLPLGFTVDTLSLPSTYEKGECEERRIEKWLARVVPAEQLGGGEMEALDMVRS